MPRARRAWSTMRTELRRLLRETTAASSFWSDASLLDHFNQSMDLRVMQLAEAHEGWMTDTYDIDSIANQSEYAIPEGTGRIKRIMWVTQEGSATYETPLTRDERFDRPLYEPGTSNATGRWYKPTYRLKGEYLILEPAPSETVVDAIRIEPESAPARLAADGDKLDLRFPDVTETLLIYDSWDIAMGVEDAQGNTDEDVRGRLRVFHRKYEAAFLEFTALRSFGRIYSTPYNLGD